MLGDLTGFGLGCFDFDGAGYVKTATEVSADNSALMRNIRRYEHALEGAIAGICRAVMAASRSLGVELPDEGEVRVTMNAWEYRQKWYGEDEKTAKARARGLARGKASNGEDT